MELFSQNRMRNAMEEGENLETGEVKVETSKTAKIFDAVITVSLVALFFGLPIFWTGLTFQGLAFDKQMYFYFWILIALIAWATKGVMTGEMKIRRTPLDIPIAIFFFVYLLATVFSVDRWHSFWGFFGDPSRGLINVIALIMVYYLIFSHFTWDRFKWMVGGVVVANVLVSLWTMLAFWGVNFLPQNVAVLAPISLLGSVSGLGIFFSLMIPIIMSIIFKVAEHENKIKRNVGAALLLLLLLSDFFLLFAIYSFTPWLGILAGVSFFLIYILAQLVRPSQNWAWLPMVSFAIVLIILMVGSVNLVKINLPVEVSPGNSLSLSIAKESLKEKFFLGTGPSQYEYSFSLHKPQDFNANSLYNLRFYQGSGIIFESLSTLGALGTIALLLILLTFLGAMIYLLSRDKQKNKIYSLGLASAALIFLIDAVTTRMEGSILLVGSILSILALAVVFKESESEEKNFSLSLKASPKFALTLAFIFMVVITGVIFLFVFVGKVYVADMYVGSAGREKAISEEGSVTKVVKAINLYPKEGRYYSRLAQEYMALVNQEVAKGEQERDISKVQAYLNNSIQAANLGKDLMKQDVLATEVAAQVYESAGVYVPDSLPLAEANYKRAQELEPHNPIFYLKLGQIKVALAASKKEEADKKQLIGEAKDLFQKSVEEKNNFDAGYYNLALVQEALGETDSAIENVQKAVSFNNQDINYVYNLARLMQGRGKEDDLKNAEAIYKRILEVNPNEINVHLSLATLYEKNKKREDAAAEYQKVLDLVPEDSKEVRTQVSKMISNAKNGIANTAENLGLTQPENTSAAQENPSSATQEVPEQNIEIPAQDQTPQSAPAVAPAP